MKYLKVYESFILNENEMKFEITWKKPDDKTTIALQLGILVQVLFIKF